MRTLPTLFGLQHIMSGVNNYQVLHCQLLHQVVATYTVESPYMTPCRGTGERIEVLALPLDESKGFTEDPSYPKSAGLLFGLMWLRAYIAAKKQLPAEHVV